MLRDYEDITSRIGTPLWYDEQGVPRYEPFRPDMCGVYDDYVALIEIACQSCGKRFTVAATWNHADAYQHRDIVWSEDGKTYRPKSMPTTEDCGFCCFGDPPIHGMCSGNTMCSDTVRIIEFWSRNWPQSSEKFMEWHRMPEHEATLAEPGD